ncbi:hypothetical protein C0993_007624 [Termitomyces sp. T159_Od127]|nr:hypothetical protein C0993_007624 [Termitomyces sp. T159_Od127]
MEAINLWLSVLYRFRFSALEDVRRINMEINIQGKNKPPYIDGAARLPGTTPEHYGMENIVGLLGAIIDAEDTSLKLKPKPKDREQRLGVEEWYVELVTGDETECVSTNRWLMKQALSLTTHNWKTKDLKRGTKGRTSALRKIARWFWIATHTPYAQLVHDKGPATETGEVYEGWDSVYLKKARIATMFAAFDPWATWYKLGPIDDPDVEGLNEEGQDGANVEDLAMFHSMRSLDGQIAGANHALKTMNDIFMKNPLFHCIVTDPKTNKPVKTLKRPVVRVLQSLYELCDEEVCNTAKHLLQDEYDYDEPLNDENRQMIHDRMLVLHEGHVIPTQRDLTLWHSPKTMEQIKKTESHANPDIERLNAARLKRSAEAEKAAKAGEKKIRRIGGIPKVNRPTMPKLTMRELLAAPPPVARKKTVSASQQERDEALIAEVERRDNDEREAAAAGKGKGKEKAVQDDQVSEGSNLTDLEDLVEEPESEEGVENEDADTSNNEGPPCNQLALASTSRSVSPSKGKRRLSAADHTVVSKRQKGEQDLTVGEVLVPSSSQVAGSSQGSMLDEDFSRLIHGGN